MKVCRNRLALAAGIVMAQYCAGVAPAAVLTGNFDPNPATPADLTSQGRFDWAIWNASGAQTGAPSNEKAGGSAISSVTALGGGALRAVGGSSQAFSYTDGTSPTSQSNVTIAALSNDGLDTVGRGYQFTVTGSTTVDNIVRVYLGGFEATGTLVASLPGATSYTPAVATYPTVAPKDRDLYTITFRPDNPTDVLTVSFTMTTDGVGANSHVFLSGVAVAPEPASASLLAIASAGLLLARRRRPATQIRS